MKKTLLSVLACAVVLLNLVVAGVAQAQPLISSSLPVQTAPSAQPNELLQLETDILPQIKSALSPEQSEKFETAIADGASFRKAFKSLSLTPAQKAKLATLLKSLPKKDIFASLTPEQRKELFMKKKEFFMPTPEEISEKISEKVKMVKSAVEE